MIERLYRQHYQPLLRYCLSLTRCTSLAEDIVQDAFLRALKNADLLNTLSEPKCLAWLYKTARNIFLDQVRRVKRMPPPCSEGIFEADFTAVGTAQLVNMLEDNDKALFLLRHFYGYNATELGRMFDLPPSTVQARLMSARRTLLQCLKEPSKE